MIVLLLFLHWCFWRTRELRRRAALTWRRRGARLSLRCFTAAEQQLRVCLIGAIGSGCVRGPRVQCVWCARLSVSPAGGAEESRAAGRRPHRIQAANRAGTSCSFLVTSRVERKSKDLSAVEFKPTGDTGMSHVEPTALLFCDRREPWDLVMCKVTGKKRPDGTTFTNHSGGGGMQKECKRQRNAVNDSKKKKNLENTTN